MKRICFALLGLLSLFLLSACAAATNPLTKALTTPMPGIPEITHVAEAPIDQASQMEITLFFRYQQTGMLAGETRTISIPKDESIEETVIRQLLAGPQASHTDLGRLFPHNTTVIDINVSGDILMVTLNEAMLNDAVPEDWTQDSFWRTEAPLRRKLTIQSLVATVTENFSYPYVQVFIVHDQASNVSTRLESSYFLDGKQTPVEMLCRDESLLMTTQNTGYAILDAWHCRDYELLYQFTQDAPRPDYQTFVTELDGSDSLVSFSTSAGYSPFGSNKATLVADLVCLSDTREITRPSVPFRLVCEDGIWKIPYAELQRLMLLPD